MYRPHPERLELFVASFLKCLLWSTTDGEDGNLDDRFSVADLAPATLAGLRDDCAEFVEAQLDDLLWATDRPEYDWSNAGHDYALSRNGHGAGYFDRDLGEVGERLQEAARQAGEVDAYGGDDGLVYVSGLEAYVSPAPPSPSPRAPKP